MSIIRVNTATPYPVIIDQGAMAALPCYIRSKKVCLVSDTNVWPLYGESVSKILNDAQIEYCSFVFPAGENSKNILTYSKLLDFLAEHQLTRNDQIIALGGGVVGDLAGFAAATYLRGISYIQVPTTLLSMVDSSVGGKTAVNLSVGKNLCGAFHQPSAVLCDMDTLATLPETDFRDGCAEIIKYSILFDSHLFAELEAYGKQFDRKKIIARCIDLKRQIIDQDERDHGIRKLLNLGHTIGHAIEQCSQFSVSHGQAVAIGMATICRGAKCVDTHRILSLLELFDLPTNCSYPLDAVYQAALHDKKQTQDQLDLILPVSIGHCRISPTNNCDFKTLLKEGL